MKILFLCTAHNSLSQRLYLVLSRIHEVSIEYALSDELMISAVALYGPDLVICPFLTAMVPKEIYGEVLTLIIHPGPPGDVGPSALDWVLMGDDGSISDSKQVLERLNTEDCLPGRTHWGITVLQAIEEFDAGPIWAFDQFELDIDQPGLTKSELYRGPITQAAISATLAAILRIQISTTRHVRSEGSHTIPQPYPSNVQADPSYGRLAVSDNLPFQGGKSHNRPLLKAAQRDFDVSRHNARQISRRIRCGDSQPGVLSKVFGVAMYIYGGILDDNKDGRLPTCIGKLPVTILGCRNQAVCISTCDGKGVWITHVRRPKVKSDKALWPKVPATSGLIQLGLISAADVQTSSWPSAANWKRLENRRTFQEVWVEFQVEESQAKQTAYLFFDFYNGAMATDQCSHLIDAMEYVISQSSSTCPVQAIVLMGGAYFSNGIALNVIEAADDPAMESWFNINRINDVVYYLLHEFPSHGIVTVAAMRGNAAAGGVALATACDIVIAGANIVLNPAYRGVGLSGSEYHTLSYNGRCGAANATKILRSMTPMSPLQAQSIGLIDYVFPGRGQVLDTHIRDHISYLLKPGILKRGNWKRDLDTSPSALAHTRAMELGEMGLDFWSARSLRYHARRFDFVRKVKAFQTPLRFATHRKRFDDSRRDEEETANFDSVEHFAGLAQEKLLASLRQKLADEVAAVMVQQGSDDGEFETAHEQAAVALMEPIKEMLPTTLEKQAVSETVFSCYYKPLEDLPTPPESPLSPSELVERVTVWS